MRKALLRSLCLIALGILPGAFAYAQEIEIDVLAAPEFTGVQADNAKDDGSAALESEPQEQQGETEIKLGNEGTEDGFAEDEMQVFPIVELRALDKITARTVNFEVEIGKTVKFGDIYIRPQICKEPPPIEDPESATFLQIWETPNKSEPKWIFSGWMYASSPALSAMDHPVYDVWVVDCKGESQETPAE